MIGSVLAHILEGVFNPRVSIERLMAARPGIPDAILMAIAAYALQFVMMVVALGSDAALGIVGHIASLLGELAYVFITGLLIFGIGRAFGGTATREQSIIVAAWHELAITAVYPLLMVGLSAIEMPEEGPPTEIPAMAAASILVFGGTWVWLLARYVAVIHGFRNTWGVVGVITSISLLLSSVFLIVAGG